jgi:hypothetical protein
MLGFHKEQSISCQFEGLLVCQGGLCYGAMLCYGEEIHNSKTGIQYVLPAAWVIWLK